MCTDQALSPKQIYDRNRYGRLKNERDAARLPDEITTLTPEERAYIAGIVDGEGSIFVAAVGPHRQRTVYPIVCVAMTHLALVQWLALRMKSGNVQKHNPTNLRRHPHWKPQYRFQVFGKRAKLLCETLLPYLKVKNRQAALVLDFPTDVRSGPGVKIDSTGVNELRYRLRDQINSMNH